MSNVRIWLRSIPYLVRQGTLFSLNRYCSHHLRTISIARSYAVRGPRNDFTERTQSRIAYLCLYLFLTFQLYL